MQDAARVVDAADAAAHRQRDENFARGAGDHVDHGVAIVARSGDVEEHQFVGALFVVARGEFHRIAGVAQVDEVHAFDHASGGDVEAGNDSLGQHLVRRNSARSGARSRPDFSGWNCTPHTLRVLEHGGVGHHVIARGRGFRDHRTVVAVREIDERYARRPFAAASRRGSGSI